MEKELEGGSCFTGSAVFTRGTGQMITDMAGEWSAIATAIGMKVISLRINLMAKVFMPGLTARSTKENGKWG